MALKAADLALAKLNQDLREEYQQEDVFFWAPMLGYATYMPSTNKWDLPETPIVKFEDLQNKTFGNELRVEMLRKIRGAGKTGKEPLVTKEKTQSFLVATLYIWGKREGIENPDWLDDLNVDWMDLAKKAYPQLKQWLTKIISTDPTACLLEGYSRHITEPTVANGGWGLGKTKQYPRNFWIWDGTNSDFATNDPGTFTYTSSDWRDLIITKLLTLVDADTFGVKTINALTSKCNVAQIKRYYMNGAAYRCIVINSLQERDLLIEGTFPTLVAQADTRGMSNTLFKNAKYVWNGWIIYVNDNVARLAYFVSATTLDFFTYSGGVEQVVSETNEDMPFETQEVGAADQDAACALILGPNCIGFAEKGKPRFTSETRDHESDTAVGIRMIYGMAILNFYDNTAVASAEAMALPQYAVVATHVKA